MLARDEELRLYLVLILIGTTLIAIEVIGGGYETGEAGIRHSLFQATAILTTTGFATADYALWGPLATVTLLLLMFSGASAGSTGGGIKIVRHLLLFKLVRRELEQTVHREAIVPIRANRARRRREGAALDRRLRPALPADVRARRARRWSPTTGARTRA